MDRPGNLTIDDNGILWFSGSITKQNPLEIVFKGLFSFDGNEFENWTSTNSDLPNDFIIDIFCDTKGRVWLYSNGLCSFDGSEFKEYDLSGIGYENGRSIHSFTEDNNGKLWFIYDMNIISYNGNKFTKLLNPKPEFPIPFLSNYSSNGIQDMAFDNDGTAYFTHNKKLFTLNNDEFSVFNSDLSLGNIVINKDNTAWILHNQILSSEKNCLTVIRFDKTGFEYFDLPTGKEPDDVTLFKRGGEIKCNINGDLWVSTDYHVWDISYGMFKGSYNEDYGEGFFNLNENGIGRHFKNELPDPRVAMFDISNAGTIWLYCNYNKSGTGIGGKSNINRSYGLTKYDGSTFITYDTLNSGIPSNEITKLRAAPNEDVWLTCRQGTILGNDLGLCVFDGNNWLNFNMSNTDLPTNTIYDFAFDKLGRTFVLFKVPDRDEYKIGIIDKDKQSIVIGPAAGIEVKEVYQFKTDSKGNSWIAAEKGLYKINPEFKVELFNLSNSPLPGFRISILEIDSADNIWIESEYGLAIFNESGVILSMDDEPITTYKSKLHIFPNPFSQFQTANYELREAGHVTLKVLDMLGNEVSTLVDGFMPAGRHEARFDASGLPEGMYILKLQADGELVTRKVVKF